ncbi:MAG TPA: redoxin domain-containing protein [Trueperaceae bacterium]|nr:redoxin domain-containing protein [Trueperaceae bacterium]
MRDGIVVGATLTDYELPDQDGVKRRLSDLQGGGAMVLMLGRGMFCPRDRQQLHQLVRFSSECDVAFTKIVTITTDDVRGSNSMRLSVGAHWPFLHDEKRTVQQDLQIKEYTDTVHDVMIPYTFVLGPSLAITRIYNGYWYWGRPSLSELHQDLREVTRATRPDWQIDTDELRSDWEAGRRGRFYPYPKPK